MVIYMQIPPKLKLQAIPIVIDMKICIKRMYFQILLKICQILHAIFELWSKDEVVSSFFLFFEVCICFLHDYEETKMITLWGR